MRPLRGSPVYGRVLIGAGRGEVGGMGEGVGHGEGEGRGRYHRGGTEAMSVRMGVAVHAVLVLGKKMSGS